MDGQTDTQMDRQIERKRQTEQNQTALLLQKTNLTTLPRTFSSDVATKYLIEWCSFFTVTVQPVGTNKTHSLLHMYQNKMYTEIINTERTCQQY